MGAPTKHARLSPSGAHTWIECPGSVTLSETLPPRSETGSIYSAEGTVAHLMADQFFSASKLPSEWLGTVVKQDGFDIRITEEMVDSVDFFISHVKDILPGIGMVHSEVKLPLFYSKNESGTSDIIGFHPKTKTLHVIDLKYGKGVKVEAENNPQLIIYGLSALDRYSVTNDIDHIVLHIVQPRLNHTPSQSFTRLELELWRDNILRRVGQVSEINPPFKPGEDQCRWCRAKSVCPALAEHVFETVGAQFDSYEEMTLPEVTTLRQEDLRNILDKKNLIDGFLKSVEAHIFNQIVHHTSFPGYKIVEGRSNRVWIDQIYVEKTLSMFLDRSLYTKTSILSPSEMEKTLKKDNLLHIVKDMITKPRGKPTLARESDPRPSLKIEADDMFENYKDEDL